MSANNPSGWAVPGSRIYWRINLALFLAGFSTFSLLYCVQPLMPMFAQQFQIGAAESSLALSLSTGCLALAILCAGALSEGRDRRWVMFGSMTLAATCNLAAALVNDWHTLLVARALAGLSLGGVPAVAMAYLADEIDPRGLGLSIGLYVSGTAFGGMAGRVGTSMLADVWSWHTALASLSVLDLAAALGFALLLPASRHAAVKRQGIPLARHLRIWRGQLTDPALPLLFMVGCLCMGVFVTIYNYAGFRLLAPPFGLSPTQIGLIFCAYVFGMAASSAAGGMADRLGQAPVLIAGVLATTVGVLLTLWPHLIGAIGGIVILTIGFFMTHAVASGWVGRMAGAHKGHAASLYLLAYYLGSSVLGSIGGWFWEHGGWLGVCLFALAGAGIMMGCALKLRQSRIPISSTSATVPTSNATAPSNA